MSEEFETIGESIRVKAFPGNEIIGKIQSPRHDIKMLAMMLIEFLRGKIPNNLYWDLRESNEGKFTSKEFQV